MKTLQQTYAQNVYQHISAYAEDHPDEDAPMHKKYGSMALKLPVLVKTSGLVQALTFVEMKGESEKAYNELLEHLALTLGVEDKDDLMQRSRTDNLQDYIHLTRQTLIALDWFKRFAQSILNVKTTDSGEGVAT